MANLCINYTDFTGSKENLTNLRQWWQTHLIDNYDNLKTLFDLPLDTSHVENKNNVFDTFGTRGIITNDLSEIDNNPTPTLNIRAETDWSPYNELLKLLCVKFNVDVLSEYEESRNDIAGTYEIREGEIFDCPSESYRHFVKETYDSEMILNYVENNLTNWEIEEFNFFKDKLSDENIKSFLPLVGEEL